MDEMKTYLVAQLELLKEQLSSTRAELTRMYLIGRIAAMTEALLYLSQIEDAQLAKEKKHI